MSKYIAPSLACTKNARGFSLIELMMVVASIAILSAIAYPSYLGHVEKADRAAARAALVEAQNFIERFYAVNDCYQRDRSGADVTLPTRLQNIPTERPRYQISVEAATANAYVLNAMPLQAVRQCGTLVLASTGERGATEGPGAAQCWR